MEDVIAGDKGELLEMTADIVSAYVGNNRDRKSVV